MDKTIDAEMKLGSLDSLKKESSKKQGILQEIKDIYRYHRRSTREFAIHDFNNVYKKAIKDLDAAKAGRL